MLRVRFIGIWWGFLVTTRRFTIAIRLICTRSGIIPIRKWWGLLPRRLSISLRLLPPLIVPSLMHIFIVIFTSYNKFVTKLIAKGVRIHSESRE
ncbi:hypothetical protein AHAS_Ahas09G0152000 [Arachis hypogaea]